MAGGGRRAADEFDASQQSDPEDDTYGARPKRKAVAAKTASPLKRKAERGGSRNKRSAKRARHRSSDDDVVSDNDSPILDTSAEEESEDSEPPATAARSTRRSAQITNYQEPDTDVDESDQDDDDDSDDDAHRRRSRPRTKRAQKLIITLPGVKVEDGTAVSMSTRATRFSGGASRRRGSSTVPTRRSGRLSHDETSPMIALSDSGRHTQIVREGSAAYSPEVEARRPSIARKTVIQGTIIEESQEDPRESAVPEDDVATVPHDPSAAELAHAAQGEVSSGHDEHLQAAEHVAVVADSVHGGDRMDVEDDDDEGGPVIRSQRQSRRIQAQTLAKPRKGPRGSREESSDFDPTKDDEEADEAMSNSENSAASPQKASQRSEASSNGRKPRRAGGRTRSRRRSDSGDSDLNLDPDELREEAEDLKSAKRRRKSIPIIYDNEKHLRRRREKVDYRIFRPELLAPIDDDEPTLAPPISSMRGRKNFRGLFSTIGPFGGAGGPVPLFPGSGGDIAGGRTDSDSSDDDGAQKATKTTGMVGMTPMSMRAPSLFPQTLVATDKSGAGAALGKVNRDPKNLAEIDPLGVDQNVTFEGVGGLENHINQLKEMVGIPLLYPEIFQSKHMTPPRGVLFYGPPGTGKTLLARALASSLSSHNQKVTFYMRKGADTLSKWVGEAERQLKLLFEDARKNQPSIIFFDEIDGMDFVPSFFFGATY